VLRLAFGVQTGVQESRLDRATTSVAELASDPPAFAGYGV